MWITLKESLLTNFKAFLHLLTMGIFILSKRLQCGKGNFRDLTVYAVYRRGHDLKSSDPCA